MSDGPTLLSQMSESKKDRYILSLEKRIAELEGNLAAMSPNEVARAEWVHTKLIELMEPFSDLRNTMTLVNQMQHCINAQSMLEAEMAAIKLMLGGQVAKEQEDDTMAHLIASLEDAGKSDVEIEAILKQMGHTV